MKRLYLFAGIWTISLMIPYWFLYKDLALMGVLLGAGGLLIIREVKNKYPKPKKLFTYVITKGSNSEN